MDKPPLVIIDFHNSNTAQTVSRTVNRLVESTQYIGNILVWDSTNTDEIRHACVDDERFQVVQFDRRFLSSGDEGRKVVSEKEVDFVILFDDSLELGPQQVDALIAKLLEYDCESIVCSQGFRIFPHKPFPDSREFWMSRRYIKYHNHEATDREIHLFKLDGGCCGISATSLIKALTSAFLKTYDWRNIGDFGAALTMATEMAMHVWKVQISLPDHVTTINQDSLTFSPGDLIELDELYRVMKDLDWPENTFSPKVAEHDIKPKDKATIWTAGFHGLNMSAEPVHLDFNAARASGASVVRFGATNDATDLKFLVKDDDDSASEIDRDYLETVLPRLIHAVAGAGESGLKVILTLCDLPGRRFRDSQDHRMWRSAECRQKIANLWGAIAEGLQEFADIIIGYDIINEPFTPDEIDLSFYCPMSSSFTIELHDLYARACKAIRAVDKETMLILESTFWASPHTMPFLLPLIDDPFVVYSFHFYAPSIYTFRHENDGRYTYPGKIPKWRNDIWKDEWPLWDENRIRKAIEPVVQWQKEHGVQSNRIFVGEFGVSREVPGSDSYLRDLMKIWEELGWNWCLFSFRDNEWDAMDYELGENPINQLNRSQTQLFKLIAKNLS